MEEGIRKLFRAYERAFSALDIRGSAECFSEACMYAGPRGDVAHGRNQLLKLASRAAERYRSVGQESARIMTMKETRISDRYSLVDIHWGVKFAQTRDTPVEFDVTYLVQHTDDAPKILLMISHQDETHAMKRLGLAVA